MGSSYSNKRRARQQDQVFQVCPRCVTNLLHADRVRNAVSRKDNETLICPPCGTSEAIRNANRLDPWPTFPEPWNAFASRGQS